MRPFVPASSRTLALVAGTLAVLTGCSDSTSGGNKAPVDPGLALGLQPGQIQGFQSVETTLSAEKVQAGTDVSVTCVASPGSVQIPKPSFTVEPKDGVTITGGMFKPTKVGTYNVSCLLNNSKKVSDASPATLVVTAAPAKDVSAKVEPSQVKAGESAVITCSAKDAYGNTIGKNDGTFTASAQPPELAEVTEMTAKGKKAGKGEVRCALDTAAADAVNNPAILEVLVGAPAKTVAKVDPPSFVAGEGQSVVSCSAVDSEGNAVTADGFTIDAPAGLTLSGKELKGNKSGLFKIKCKLPGVSEETAATLTVDPAEAVSIALGLKPDNPVYKIDDTVKVYLLGTDKFGNVGETHLTDPVAVDPPEAATVNGGGKSYSFSVDGYVTFSYTSPKLKDDKGNPAVATLKVKVDSTGPLLLISTPKRGATLNGDAKVAVKGTCIDELSAVKSLKINEQTVKVESDGSFSFEMQALSGMNVLLWTAEDEWGNASTGVQTFYYSTKWYPIDDKKPELANVKNGVGFWMSQSVVDAGPPHNHKAPKDLASVAEVVIGSIDLKGLLASQGLPFSFSLLSGEIKFKDLKFGDQGINEGYPEVNLTVIKGGLHIATKIHNMQSTVTMDIQKPLPYAQDFVVTADWIWLETDLLISLDPATGKPVSEAKNTKLKIQNLKVKLGSSSLPSWLSNLVSGGANALIGFVEQFIQGPITGLIEQVMQGQIQKMLGDTLGSALAGLALNTELPLKPFIGAGEEVKIKLATKLGLLEFLPTQAQSGGILVGMDGSVTSPHKVPHDVLGSYGRAGCLKPGAKDVFNPGLKYALEVGLGDDFANQLVHAVWNGGLLQLKIGADALGSVDLGSFGVKDLSVDTDFLLPPILNTCVGKAGELKLQIGDLGVHAKMQFNGTPVDVYMFAAMQATAELKAVENPKTKEKELSIALKSVDFLEMEITQINAEAKSLKDLFQTLIKSVLLPQLTKGLGDGLGSFPLPALDLSALSPQIPKGTSLALEIQQIDNEGGYTYLRGKVK